MVFFQALFDNGDPQSFASRLRQLRTQRFIEMLKAFPEPVKVLDVGGALQFWRQMSFPCKCQVTLLNLEVEDCGNHPVFTSVAGDARAMSNFPDRSFDICFSNSVIEHVGTLQDQIQMGREIRRVAKSYFVQTPNRYFPLEPHFLLPLWQFYPVSLRVRLLRRFDLGWMKQTPDALSARAAVEQIRLLSASEMRGIFPDARLVREKLGPFTKSLIAMKSADHGFGDTTPLAHGT